MRVYAEAVPSFLIISRPDRTALSFSLEIRTLWHSDSESAILSRRGVIDSELLEEFAVRKGDERAYKYGGEIFARGAFRK